MKSEMKSQMPQMEMKSSISKELLLTAEQIDLYQSLCTAEKREVGVDLFFDASGKNDGYRLLLGNTESVPIWGYSNVFGHTHPPVEESMPPSSVDYYRSLWEFFAGIQWQLVFEKSVTWAFRPNEALITYIEGVDPLVREHVTKRQKKMAYTGSAVTYMLNHFNTFHEAVLTNASIDNRRFKSGEINLEDYINNMGKCIDNSACGFEVRYFKAGTTIKLDSGPAHHSEERPKDICTLWDKQQAKDAVNRSSTYSWAKSIT